MRVTVVLDLQNNNEVLGVYSETVVQIRKKAISELMEDVESRDEAESMVEDMYVIESYTVRKYAVDKMFS